MAEGVLGEIVRAKRAEVAERLTNARFDPEPSKRSLRAALAKPGARFILEVKKASPSGHRSSATVEQAVSAYAPLADAISVLTDKSFFGGSLDDLRQVRARFDGPILAKDFVIDPAQVVEARAHGADAVLAMLSVLSDAEAGEVLEQARRLSMDVLVEVHDRDELDRALALGAAIIGVNNRDLKTLRTDLAVTEQLAPLVPADRLLVSESGIAARQDVERLSPHVDAFLVGSSLMSADHIGQAARQLLFGPVKICGLTNIQDARSVAAAGATHAGFIFVPGTPRAIDLQTATRLVAESRSLGLRAVGVFRDSGLEQVASTARTLDLDAVQLHGGRVTAAELRPHLRPGCEIWSLAAVGNSAETALDGADRTLFDTRIGVTSGGTGTAFDWQKVAGRPDLPEAFLAGGITPANVRAAQRVGAYGLDVCSGVEQQPGRKDPAKLDALFDALRPACRRHEGLAQCA